MKNEKRFITKGIMASMLALTLACSTMVPVMEAEAATIEKRYIRGDGVRLRKQGHENGTILELMYNGEAINYYPTVYGTDPEYNYMRRLKTKTYGYVRHEYAFYRK